MSDAASPPPNRTTAADRDAVTIADAARRAVDRWLQKTVRLVAECARHSTRDAEDIHRLRVAIRHTDAALITFQSLLPRKKCRRLRKRLKHLRRQAGDIRDIDVLLERTASLGSSNGDGIAEPGADLQENRRMLAKELQSSARDEINDHFKRRTRGIVKRTRWRGPDDAPLLSSVAPAFLSPIAASSLEASTQDLSDQRRLHHFRVCVKRLRYAVEFLQAGLPHDPAAGLQAQLSAMQQRLGDVCDHAAAVQLLAAERKSPRGATSAAALDGLIAREHALLAARQSEFVAWWDDVGRAQLKHSIDQCLA
jgi:CHAD domain-containing protein